MVVLLLLLSIFSPNNEWVLFFFICFVSRSRNTSRARVKNAMSSLLVSE